MRRVLVLLTAAIVSLGGVSLVAAPAEAATAITIKTLKNRTVAYQGSTVIKPAYTKGKGVKITKAVLTVTKGSTTVARAKTAVRVKPGTYGVTTAVSYRVKKNGHLGSTRTAKKSQSLTVTEGAKKCATKADYDTVVVSDPADTTIVGDSQTTVATKLFSEGEVFAGPQTLQKARADAVKDKDREGVEYFDGLIERFGQDAQVVGRVYLGCAKGAAAAVFFVNDANVESYYLTDLDDEDF